MKNLIRKILKEEMDDDYSWISDPFRVEPKIITYLEKNYPIQKMKSTFEFFNGKDFIMIGDKSYFLENNKKLITKLLFLELEEVFRNIEKGVIRRSIRKYINTPI